MRVLRMRQTAKIISTYTSDASGVASALYELGGMTVIHDASGCNSTYNTHDEPRWYDMDSLVFISALTEMEAVMGDDAKLIGDIAAAAKKLHPKFIALCGTPIPMMVGFDFRAVSSLVEQETGIPAFGIPTNGMHTYVSGAGQAFSFLAERMAEERKDKVQAAGCSVNLIGVTPLDYSVNGMAEDLERTVERAGFTVISNWAMNGGYAKTGEASVPSGKAELDRIRRAAEADVNLVVSSAGLMAAKVLKRRFGTPFVTGVPVGQEGMDILSGKLRAAAEGKKVTDAEAEKPGGAKKPGGIKEPADIVLIGEPVMQQSIAEALRRKTGRSVMVLSAILPEDYGETEQKDSLLSGGSVFAEDEDDIIPLLSGVKTIIADPLYRPISPESAEFIPLPHEAFSGRIYREEIPDIVRGLPEEWKL